MAAVASVNSQERVWDRPGVPSRRPAGRWAWPRTGLVARRHPKSSSDATSGTPSISATMC